MIKSFTVYTKKLFNKFANTITFKKRTVILNYVLGVVLLIIAIYCFSTRKYISATFFVLFSAFFSCSRLISMAFINRFNANYLNTYDRFCFYDDYFTVNSYLPGGTLYSEAKHLYSEVEGVDFCADFAYIYLDQSKIYILVKENFKEQADFDWLVQNLSATKNAKKMGINYTMPKLSEYLAEKKSKDKTEAQEEEIEKTIEKISSSTKLDNKPAKKSSSNEVAKPKAKQSTPKKTTSKKDRQNIATEQVHPVEEQINTTKEPAKSITRKSTSGKSTAKTSTTKTNATASKTTKTSTTQKAEILKKGSKSVAKKQIQR
ncbi:MAG: hypothetical protein ACI4L7_03195 [Christensenellales bacterium]